MSSVQDEHRSKDEGVSLWGLDIQVVGCGIGWTDIELLETPRARHRAGMLLMLLKTCSAARSQSLIQGRLLAGWRRCGQKI